MIISIKDATERCTDVSTKLYYVLIRGRVYTSWRGTTTFRSKSGAVQSVLHWSAWSRGIEDLAREQFKFSYPDSMVSVLGRKETPRPKYLEEYLKFKKGVLERAFKDQVEIKEIVLTNTTN